MLQRMRAGIQGWVAWLIVIALIASLGLFGVSFYLHGGEGDDNKGIAAKVNNAVISQQEVQASYERLNPPNSAPVNAALEEQKRQVILQSLIDKNLLLEAARQNNFRVSQTQLTSTVVQIPQFQEHRKFSQARYLSVINQFGYNSASFLQRMQNDLLLNQIQAGLSLTSFVLPQDVLNMMRNIKQKRNITYLVLPFEKQSAPKMDLSKAVPEYYQAHLKEFQTAEKIRVNYLVLSDRDMAKTLTPTSAQLKQFYQENLSQYSRPAEFQIAHLLVNHDNAGQQDKIKKVEAGLTAKKDFSVLVQDFSDDLLSANKGGVLPSMPAAQLPGEFKAVVITLKPGQISSAIQTQQGTEWIKLLSIKAASVSPFETVESQVRKFYLDQKTQKLFADKTQQLQDLVFQNPASLEAAAKNLGLTVQTSDWLFPNVPSKTLWNSQALIQAAFSDAVKAGNNSEILYPDAHSAVVLHVKEYQAAKMIPLPEVESKIHTILIEKARRELTAAHAEKIVKALNQGTSLEQIKKQESISWSSLNNVGRHDSTPKMNSLMLSTAFNLARPTAHTLSAGSVMMNDGVGIAVVTAVHDPDGGFLDTDKKIYTTQLQEYYREFSLLELLNFYRHQAKVEIYQAQLSAN